MNAVVKQFVPLVDFLAKVFGSGVEIVLHDFSNVKNSVVKIQNNHVSGRSVGAPATNFALQVIKDIKSFDQDYLINYFGKSQFGEILQSSSYIIRDDAGKIVGMLCINIDLKNFSLNNTGNLEVSPGAVREKLSKTVDDVTDESIDFVLGKVPVEPERLSQDEKIDVVRELYENGVFLMKGTVSKIAKNLKVSEASVYRYLEKVRKEEQEIS